MKNLDLHGVRHMDVAYTVKRFIEDNLGCGETCAIICGNSLRMQHLAKTELSKYRLEVKVNTYAAGRNITATIYVNL